MTCYSNGGGNHAQRVVVAFPTTPERSVATARGSHTRLAEPGYARGYAVARAFGVARVGLPLPVRNDFHPRV